MNILKCHNKDKQIVCRGSQWVTSRNYHKIFFISHPNMTKCPIVRHLVKNEFRFTDSTDDGIVAGNQKKFQSDLIIELVE